MSRASATASPSLTHSPTFTDRPCSSLTSRKVRPSANVPANVINTFIFHLPSDRLGLGNRVRASRRTDRGHGTESRLRPMPHASFVVRVALRVSFRHYPECVDQTDNNNRSDQCAESQKHCFLSVVSASSHPIGKRSNGVRDDRDRRTDERNEVRHTLTSMSPRRVTTIVPSNTLNRTRSSLRP